MPHVTANELLQDAYENGYAVPGLSGCNLEMVVGQLRAAEELRAPVILLFNQELVPQMPIELGMPMLVNAAERATVPVATEYDHGKSMEPLIKSIRLGSSAIMFDGSSLSYEDNVERTREMCRIGHAAGIAVEGELGSLAGSALSMEESGPECHMTHPEATIDFVERTGVDLLAISFGNVHGLYRGEPHLDFDRVRQIRSLVRVPLVMHGGSGLDEDMYRRIARSGISVVRYHTAMARAAGNDIQASFATGDPHALLYQKIITRAIDFYYQDAKRLINLLGCAGTV